MKNNYEVAIIDYGMSNLHSVKAACGMVGIKSFITSDPQMILSAKAAILPGVGAFGQAMFHLKEQKLDYCVKSFVESGRPFFGICLGMQLLFSESDEYGAQKGLGLLNGVVRKFDLKKYKSKRLPVPQIGWNKIDIKSKDKNNGLLKKIKAVILCILYIRTM